MAFADLAGKQTSFTGDRTEFLGRNGSYNRPNGLEQGHILSGKLGAGLDPCGALQAPIELRPGGTAEIVFFLGQAENARAGPRTGAANTARKDLNRVLLDVVAAWDDILETVQVSTPDRAMDLMLNRWLLYQTLCMPHLGPRRLLPIERRVRLPRPVAGRYCAHYRAWREIAREQILRAACPPVLRRRRAALVASAIGPRSAHAHFRRSHLAAVHRDPIYRSHRRHRRSERSRAVSGWRRLWPKGSTNPISSRIRPRKQRHLVRTLRSRARLQPGRRQPRSAVDGHGRLERRHESRGPGRQRGKCLARAGSCIRFCGSFRKSRTSAENFNEPKTGGCRSAR